jgi:transposase-like protein
MGSWKRDEILHLDKKQKIVLEVLREEKTLNEVAAMYEVHPNQLSRWKAEFLSNAGRVFSKETVAGNWTRRVMSSKR